MRESNSRRAFIHRVCAAFGMAGVAPAVLAMAGCFEASHVIVTVPLGVLKSGSITFEPALPERKQQAIDALGMGGFEKVVLTYDAAFWGDDWDLLAVDGGPDGALTSWFDMTPFAGAPALACIYGADIGREMQDTMSDTELVALAHGTLAAIFGEIPAPAASQVTRWRSDPYSLGSYSFIAAGASPDDQDALAAPVAGRLMFAGEATMRGDTSTVHGAIRSGLREAQRLVPSARLPG